MARNILSKLSFAATLCLLFAGTALASQYNVIFQFPGGPGGLYPHQLIADAAGNLYGTTEFAGATAGDGWGVVFKLSNVGGTWTETVLYTFTGGADGGQPEAGLAMDAKGNLYGTTAAGGLTNCPYGYCGVVFELSPNANGTWTESVLHTFTGPDGIDPQSSVVLDAAGNIYGTTGAGGLHGSGTVFELSPNGNGTWTQTILRNFGPHDGGGTGPVATPVFDAAGNLYGATLSGGNDTCNSPYGCGTIFKLTPNGDGTWASRVIHTFNGPEGAAPVWVGFDGSGNLLGATANGGYSVCSDGFTTGCGTNFQLTPTSGTQWQFSLIHEFLGRPGASPNGLAVDASGNLWGATAFSGTRVCGSTPCGTVYELTPNGSGQYKFIDIHQMEGGSSDGYEAVGAPIFGPDGNLYGVSFAGGSCTIDDDGCGIVYQVVP